MQSDTLTIVREHMYFIVRLLTASDFKRTVNWPSLASEDVAVRDGHFADSNLQNFVILTAIKI